MKNGVTQEKNILFEVERSFNKKGFIINSIIHLLNNSNSISYLRKFLLVLGLVIFHIRKQYEEYVI